MAGAGYKLFATGDVLTAAQVNTYLMEQTVMRFADSAARTTALSGVLAEGMVSYLQDTNTLEVYDGAAWVGATGDITGLTAGTGISISSATGPVPTVTNSMATEITAKGDLIVGTGSGTFDNLPVAENGSTIVADSSASVGIRYQVPVNPNPVINSAMQVWQRGTSFTDPSGVTANTADRWIAYIGATGRTISRQVTGDTTNLPFIQYCLRYQRNSGTTNTNIHYLIQQFETINTIPYAGKTVTLSFYARRGAGFASTDGTGNQLTGVIRTSTSTDGNALSGPWVDNLQPVGGVTTGLSTTWQRYSFTGTLSSTATSMAVQISCQPTGTAAANDFFEVTGLQVECGSVATPFKTYAATIQGELAACQRYFYDPLAGVTDTDRAIAPTFMDTTTTIQGELAACARYFPVITVQEATGYGYATNNGIYTIPFLTEARTAPTGMTIISGSALAYGRNVGYSVTPAFNSGGKSMANVTVTSGLTLTAGEGSRLGNNFIVGFTGCEL
jgi:hypothetical protein